MKSLNFGEFNSYVHWAGQLLEEAQLQDVWTNGHQLVMEFYKFRPLWLVADLQMRSPQIILIQNQRPPVTKKAKPVSLFLNSHGKNLRVEFFKSIPEYGRVAILQLSGGEKSCAIEMQLVPSNVNFSAASGGKKIFWEKPKVLPKVPNPSSEVFVGRESEWLGKEKEWLNSLGGSPEKTTALRTNEKAIAKKQKALEEMAAKAENYDEKRWQDLGEHLKTHQDMPAAFIALMDAKIGRSENIERAFQKAKDAVRKKQGTLARMEKIRNDIIALQSSSARSEVEKKSTGTRGLEKAHARGRKLQLENGMEAVCGRSGKDNLAILRQARAWDLWLHLKDYPGAHAIIFRERNVNVDVSQLEKTAQWLIQESPAAKGASQGGKYDVVVAETRFVRPIKGDSLGRVTYHNQTVYSFASKIKR